MVNFIFCHLPPPTLGHDASHSSYPHINLRLFPSDTLLYYIYLPLLKVISVFLITNSMLSLVIFTTPLWGWKLLRIRFGNQSRNSLTPKPKLVTTAPNCFSNLHACSLLGMRSLTTLTLTSSIWQTLPPPLRLTSSIAVSTELFLLTARPFSIQPPTISSASHHKSTHHTRVVPLFLTGLWWRSIIMTIQKTVRAPLSLYGPLESWPTELPIRLKMLQRQSRPLKSWHSGPPSIQKQYVKWIQKLHKSYM